MANLNPDEIKKEYDKYFDNLNQLCYVLNTQENQESNPGHIPYFCIKTEEDRIKNPTLEDLELLIEELENLI